jgi:hypothetical protein
MSPLIPLYKPPHPALRGDLSDRREKWRPPAKGEGL